MSADDVCGCGHPFAEHWAHGYRSCMRCDCARFEKVRSNAAPGSSTPDRARVEVDLEAAVHAYRKEAERLRQQLAAAEASLAQYRDGVRWALGYEDFEPRVGQAGAFWWRPELARRVGWDWDAARAASEAP